MVVHPLESAHRSRRPLRGAVPSIAMHAAIVLLAVHATAHAALPAAHHDSTPPAVFVAPERPATRSVDRAAHAAPRHDEARLVPDAPRITVPLKVPVGIRVPDPSAAIPPVGAIEFGRGVAPVATLGSGTATRPGSAPYTAAEVERGVEPLPGAPTPAYPEPLRASGVRGSVTVEFVVDTTGRAEPASFRAIGSDGDLFTAAVRAAVLHTRFRPAEAGGRRVRQLVQQSFTFVLQ